MYDFVLSGQRRAYRDDSISYTLIQIHKKGIYRPPNRSAFLKFLLIFWKKSISHHGGHSYISSFSDELIFINVFIIHLKIHVNAFYLTIILEK